MIPRQDLVEAICVPILLEHHEVPHQLKQPSRIKRTPDQRLKFQGARAGFLLAFNRPPHLEPFLAGRERPHPRLQPVGHHQHLVEHKE